MNNPKRQSTVLRAKQIKQIVSAHYEPGRQDKCLRAVWRNFVLKDTGISERTFYKYLGIDTAHSDENNINENQLQLCSE